MTPRADPADDRSTDTDVDVVRIREEWLVVVTGAALLGTLLPLGEGG